MMVAGDEFGRTQEGNNNAYCQDNPISWLNWDIGEPGQSLIRFVSKVARIRRNFPILRRERFLTGAYNEELQIKELTWLTPSGTEMHRPTGKIHRQSAWGSSWTAAPNRPASASAAATVASC